MVPILSLWMPILLSAVVVFIVSSIIHMVFKYHSTDFLKVPEEAKLMEALSQFDLPRGDYAIPCAGSIKELGSPEFIDKQKQGPNAFITVLPNVQMSITSSLIQWFLYSIVVSFFAAYVAGRALGPDAHYLEVFRFVGCVSFVGYSLALLQSSIWYKRSWVSTMKSMFDGLVYGLATAGVFGWLWPA